MKRKLSRMGAMLLAVIMIASLCLPMGGCESGPEPNSELNIDVPPFKEDIFNGAIAAYKAAYPNVTVNVTSHKDLVHVAGNKAWSEEDEMEEYYSAYRVDLMAGKGSDVIYGMRQVPDLYKTIQAGAFADLTEFMEADADFDYSSFDQTALKAGKFQGKQLIMPLSCKLMFLITTQRILDETGFDIESASRDWLTFMEAAKTYVEESGDTKPFFYFCISNTIVQDLLPYAAIPFINYEEKRINPEYKTEIKRVAEIIQFFDPWNDNFVLLPDEYGYNDLANPLRDDASRFSYSWRSGYILPVNLSYLSGQGESPVLIPLRSFDGKSMFQIGECVGINNASPNKQNAWNFIKFLMNESAQSGDTISYNSVPVLISARKRTTLNFRHKEYDIPCHLPPMNDQIKALTDQYDEAIMNPDGTFLRDMDGCAKFFELAAENHLDPVKDYDKAVELLERYLSE